MKYIFGAIFALLILLSFVAVGIQPKPIADGKIVLTWTVDENESRKEQVALFEKEYPEYRVKVDQSNMDRTKVIVQSLAGVGPDLYCCYNGMDLSAFVKSDMAWDITDELAEMGIDPLTDCWSGAEPTFLYEGRIYGFPNNVGSDALWFNKDLFDALGVPYPEGVMTWDELIPIAKKMTVREANGRIKHFGLSFPWFRWPHFMKQWGGRMYTPDGTKCVIDNPETIAALQFMYDLVYKHKVAPSPIDEVGMATQGGWGSGSISLFGSGKYAMALGGRWWLMLLRQMDDLRLGVCENPHGPKRIILGYGKSTIINRNSPRRKDALKFLEFMARRPYNDLISHQADALGPVKEFSYSETFLHDPDFPEETYNHIWREEMAYSQPEEVSPFINGSVVMRIMTEQIDLVSNDYKMPGPAMHDAAKQINKEILKTIKREPALLKKYEQLTGRKVVFK